MVEHRPEPLDLDAVFQALAHPTRRDLLEAVVERPERIGTLAEPFDVSLAAISKHVAVLEGAGLVEVEADGRIRRCHSNAAPFGAAFRWLTRYRVFWEDRFDGLAIHLESEDDT